MTTYPIKYQKSKKTGQRYWPITHFRAVRDDQGRSLMDVLPDKALGFGTCSTAAATAAKTVTINDFVFGSGSTIIVKFTNGISVDNASLAVTYVDKQNVQQTTSAIPIYYHGSALAGGRVKAGASVVLNYNGTQLDIVGDVEKAAPVYQRSYTAIADPTGKNPSEEGWYEVVAGEYTQTSDTTPQSGKTYYKQNPYYKMIY